MAITDPDDITGIAAWYAADTVVLDGTNQIQEMTNKSTVGEWVRLFQGDSLIRPVPATLNGIDFAAFDKTDDGGHGDVLEKTGNQTPSSLVAMTVVLAIQLPSASGDLELFLDGDKPSASPSHLAVWKSASNNLEVGRVGGDDIYFSVAPSGWDWGDLVQMTILFDFATKTATIRIDGVQVATGSGVASLLIVNGISIGGRAVAQGGTERATCQIGAVAVYDHVLTGTDLTDIEDFFDTTYTSPPLVPPVADAGPDQTVVTGLQGLGTVTLDGTGSFDTDGTIDNYKWTRGRTTLADGSNPSPVVILEAQSQPHVITLEVTDNSGLKSTDQVNITIQNAITSHVRVINTTGLGPFNFADVIKIFPNHIELPEDQIRVLKKVGTTVTELFPKGREDASGNFQWQFDPNITSPTGIKLEVGQELLITDELVIMRETRMDRPVANINITPGSLLRRRDDLNTRGDQILFICQELRELRDIADILGSGAGDVFEYDTSIQALNTSLFEQAHVGDGVTTTFSYADIEMLPREGVSHDLQLFVIEDNKIEPITVNAVDRTVTITSGAAVNGATVIIRRTTRIDKRWVQHTDADTFSSVFMNLDFLNIKFIVEETIDFPIFISITNPLNNRIFARRINEISYSGPGDRFFFGNLPWFGDGAVFVFEDDIPLSEFNDYNIDFLFWDIIFPVGEDHSNLLIRVTNPFHAFHTLPFENPNPVVVTKVEDEFTAEGNFIVLSKFVDTGDIIQNHDKLELGVAQAPAPADAKGGVILIRSGDLGDDFPGSTIVSATMTIENIKSNSMTATAQFDAMDETFAGKTTYAALSSEYVTAASKPTVQAGTGSQTYDAKVLFQAIADLDTIQEAFLVGHEEPFPADASSGFVRTGSVITFRVVYKLPAPVTGQQTLDLGCNASVTPIQLVQILCPADYSASGLNFPSDQSKSCYTFTASLFIPCTNGHRASQILVFDLTDAPDPVSEAHLNLHKIRWVHKGVAAPETMRFRRITHIAPIDILKVSWDNRINSVPTAWLGSTGTGQANINGGAVDDLDSDSSGELTRTPPPALNNNVIIEDNVVLFNLKPMIDAARAAGQTALSLVVFFNIIATGGNDQNTFATLDALSTVCVSDPERIELVITGT